MTQSAVVSVEVPADLAGELDALAESTGRSAADLTAQAIADFVQDEEWRRQAIRSAIDYADAGGEAVAHDDVRRWIESWGTDQETPPPR